MKTKLQLISLIFLAALGAPAHAQSVAPASGNSAAPPSAAVQRSEADLEKLVAPIALYPDPLLATLLPASAYPLEIVQAARFIKDTNNISKLDAQPWDSNVKAIAHFPDVIEKMDADIGWTSDLGQAFVEDQKSVLNAVQTMRGKAQQVGSLKTTQQQIIVVTNTVIQILPAETQIIYVPEYNPAVVYVAPPPPPSPGAVAAASIVSFGVGLAVGAVIANNCDWHSGGIYIGPHGGAVWGGGYHGDVNINRNVNINVNHSANGGGADKWQPDASRRTSTPGNVSSESRGWGNGSSERPAGKSAFSNSGGAQTREASHRGAASHGGGLFGGGGGHAGGLRGHH